MSDPLLGLAQPAGRPFRLLALGAHADDVEIGAGGTILRLAHEAGPLEARWVVLSAAGDRAAEAHAAAAVFLGVERADVRLGSLRDAWFPAAFETAKETLLAAVTGFEPDLVLCPSLDDRHQDHRLLGELAWQVFRDHQIWEYEIPKYEGDLGRPNLLVRLSAATARRKAELLRRCFPSQLERPWFDPEVFLGLMRIRGLEARAPEGYAEAFLARKMIL